MTNVNEAISEASFLLLQTHTLKAQSISEALTRGGYVSCGIFCEPAPALEHLASQQPAFFLTESYLAGVNGYDLVRQAKQLCRADCIMRVSDTGLSTHDALTTNLSGYLTPGAGPEEYLTCLRHIRQGRRYVSPALMDWLRDTAGGTEKGSSRLRRLSDREKQVLRLLADGLENDAIADALGISSTTLTSHFANLKQKLGLTTTRQLVIYAARHSLPGTRCPAVRCPAVSGPKSFLLKCSNNLPKRVRRAYTNRRGDPDGPSGRRKPDARFSPTAIGAFVSHRVQPRPDECPYRYAGRECQSERLAPTRAIWQSVPRQPGADQLVVWVLCKLRLGKTGR